MVGRTVTVHAMSPYYEDAFFPSAAAGLLRWEWGGNPRTPEGFHLSLWNGATEAFVPVDKYTGRALGIIRIYGTNVFHGFCSLAVFLEEPDSGPRSGPAEALWLVASHLFADQGVRKIYGDLTESTFERFSSGSASLFTVEGRLTDHHRTGSSFEDKVIVAFHRSTWEELASGPLAQVRGGLETRQGDR